MEKQINNVEEQRKWSLIYSTMNTLVFVLSVERAFTLRFSHLDRVGGYKRCTRSMRVIWLITPYSSVTTCLFLKGQIIG